MNPTQKPDNNSASILVYHSVGNDGSFLAVMEEKFERQLKYISENKYPVIKLSELYKQVEAGKLDAKSIVLTFDDAYENFYTIAWPLLKKYQMPATVFVPTGLIGKTWKISDGTVLPIMSAEMIQEIASDQKYGHLVEFMPHTEMHPDLSRLASEKFDEEIEKSRARLKNILGEGNYNILSYPFGRANKDVVEYLKNNAWIGAVGMSPGFVSESSDPYFLPRNFIGRDTTMVQFISYLSVMRERNKKRVLVILPDRFEKSAGGMGAQSGPIFEAMSDEWEFYVAAYPLVPGTQAPEFVAGYRPVTAPFTEVKFGALNLMIAQTEYFAAAASFPKPDLVYAYDWSIYLAAVRTAEHFGVPLVTRMCLSAILLSNQGYHFGLDVAEPLHKALHNAFCEMEIRGLKKADLIVQISEGYAAMYDKIAPFRPKTRIVYNGINLAEWRKENVVAGTKPFVLPGKNNYKIVFIGRLVEMKGIIPLCKAKVPDGIDLIFIGDENRADVLCREAIAQKKQEKKQEESNFYTLGALYGQEKIAALRAADAVIIPSHHEAFGNVGLEALAAGCIPISSRAGGMKDYLTDATSLYCGTKIETIEQAYRAFLALSDADRGKLHKAGREMVDRFTIENSAQSLGKVFDEAIHIKGR